MMPFHALLINTEAFNLLQELPMLIGMAAAVLLLIAFFIGFAKGFRKVGWGGIVWVAASGGYFLLERSFGEENPLNPIFATVITDNATAAFLASFVCAMGCILLALLLQGVCSLLFRPRIKLVAKDKNQYTRDENGIEYEVDDKEFDDYEDYHSGKMVVRKGMRKPSFFGRLFGGLICTVNLAAVLVAVLSVALFGVCAMRFNEGLLAPAFQNEYMPFVQEYAILYAFDFLMIGLILKTARKGFEKGFMDSFRLLVIGVGRLVAIGFAFYIPFSGMALSAEEGGIEIAHAFVSRCIDAAQMMGLPETYAPIVGQLLAGILLFVLVLIAFAILRFFLKTITEAIDGIGLFRMVDGVLACVTYLAIGAAICTLIGVAFYVVGAYGIFDINTLIGKTSLVKKLLDACGVYIQPALDSFNAMVAGFIPA